MEEPKVISATLLRTKTRDILEEAKFSGGHFVVETFGKPMAVIVGVDEYMRLVDEPGRRSARTETQTATREGEDEQ
jgi:hypothetical protein